MARRKPQPVEEKVLDSFIKEAKSTEQKNSEQNTEKEEARARKNMEIKISVDNALKMEAMKTKQKQYAIVEKALIEYLRKKGYTEL